MVNCFDLRELGLANMTQERHQLPVDAPVTGAETWLIVYSLGLTLDKIASVLEHGWSGMCLPACYYAFH
jgi:hypothetical protein